jgi:ABC-type Fe3+-siderophore transport system permease subunit
MSRFWRNLLSIFIGAMLGVFGGLMVCIFWPLLFPESLQGSSWGEDAGLTLAFIACFSLFGATGFLLCRRLTKKYVRDKDTITVLFR